MGLCALLVSFPQPIRGEEHRAPVALGPQRFLGFHLIKLSHNENPRNEINFNYLSAVDLRERLH